MKRIVRWPNVFRYVILSKAKNLGLLQCTTLQRMLQNETGEIVREHNFKYYEQQLFVRVISLL